MGVADTMVAVQNLLLIITLLVVLLVTILMERSFVADEKSQIAILKAVGFRNKAIVKWHVIRFGICTVIAIAAAVILSVPMTYLCITPIFKMMGMVKVSFDFDVLKLAVYTGIVLVFTMLMAWITSQAVRRVKSSDTANNE
jgi:putative ABC transport system permease protein